MKVLAVIPARAGSQRLPGKNRLEIQSGISLTQHAIDCARFSGVVDRVVVSTDDTALTFVGADYLPRPLELSGPRSDIRHAVHHAFEATGGDWDYVVTLQPAVLARSPLIVKDLVTAVVAESANGGVTAAHALPWIHEIRGRQARYSWYGGDYPRSQDSGLRMAEVNAVQVASKSAVLAQKRWDLPLIYAELPPWAVALDIDLPHDLEMARNLWPIASKALETWVCPLHLTTEHGKI